MMNKLVEEIVKPFLTEDTKIKKVIGIYGGRFQPFGPHHLRTYKWFLYNSIQKQDLKSNIDGKYFWHASDLAFQYQCLEMCPIDKIGVLDFPTYVLNVSKDQVNRTRERESSENEKYEMEVRSRRKYKRAADREELGNKMHQIGVVDQRIEMCSVPSKFSYNSINSEIDAIYLCDGEILEYLKGNIVINKNVPIVVRLFEQRDYFKKQLMQAVIDNHDKFHTILTFDKIILNSVPNARFCNAEGITHFVCQPNPFGEKPFH